MEDQTYECENSQGISFPKPELHSSHQHKTLEERIRESGCELTGIGEIDWGEPQGREIW